MQQRGIYFRNPVYNFTERALITIVKEDRNHDSCQKQCSKHQNDNLQHLICLLVEYLVRNSAYQDHAMIAYMILIHYKTIILQGMGRAGTFKGIFQVFRNAPAIMLNGFLILFQRAKRDPFLIQYPDIGCPCGKNGRKKLFYSTLPDKKYGLSQFLRTFQVQERNPIYQGIILIRPQSNPFGRQNLLPVTYGENGLYPILKICISILKIASIIELKLKKRFVMGKYQMVEPAVYHIVINQSVGIGNPGKG